MICPKCNYVQQGDVECESCGIIFEKYQDLIVKKKLNEAIQLYNEGNYQVALDVFEAIINVKIYQDKQIGKKCEEYINKIQEILKNPQEENNTQKKKSQERMPPPIECPNCATPIQAGAKFCGKCGAAISTEHACPKCNSPLKTNAKFCGSCGQKIKSTNDTSTGMRGDTNKSSETYTSRIEKKKSPVIAFILSFIWPGAGQLYLNQFQLGFTLLISTFILWNLSLAIGLPFFLLLLLWIGSMISAYKDGKVLQQGHSVHKFGFFWAKLNKLS